MRATTSSVTNRRRSRRRSRTHPDLSVCTPLLQPPPRIASPLSERLSVSAGPTSRPSSRTSFTTVQTLFELEEPIAHSAPVSPVSTITSNIYSPVNTTDHRNRFETRPLARPPQTRPDPSKCSVRHRPVVRQLFEELSQFENRAEVTQVSPDKIVARVPKKDHKKQSEPYKVNISERRRLFDQSNTDNTPVINSANKTRYAGFTPHHLKMTDNNDYYDDNATEQVSEYEMASEVDHEAGSYAHHQGQQKFHEQYKSQHHDEEAHQEEYEETEVASEQDRRSASSANSFDQVAEQIAEDLQVFEQGLENAEIRPHGEPIPERNKDRIFSEAADEEDTHTDYQPVPPKEVIRRNGFLSRNTGFLSTENEQEEEHANQAQEQKPEYQESEYQEEDYQEEEHQEEEHEEVQHEEEYDEEEQVREVEEEIHEYAQAAGGNTPRQMGDNDSEPTMPGPPPSFTFRSERLSRNMAEAMANIWDRFWTEDVRQIRMIVKNRFSQLTPYIRRFIQHVVAFWGGITYIRRALTAFVRILKRDERVRELAERIGWASATSLRIFLSMCAMLMQATLQFYHLMRDRIIPDARRVIPILYYKVIVRLLFAAKKSPWSTFLGPFGLTFSIDHTKIPDPYLMHEKLSIPQHDVTFANMNDLVQTMRDTMYRSRYPTTENGQAETEVEGGEEYTQHYEQTEEVEQNYQPSEAQQYETTQGYEQNEDIQQQDYYQTYDENKMEEEEAEEEYEDDEIASTSTPVHTQTTDEMPRPPPTNYEGPQYHRGGSSKESNSDKKQRRESFGPLTEMTNHKMGWTGEAGHADAAHGHHYHQH